MVDPEEIQITVNSLFAGASIKGFLTIPDNAKGVVIFAHGSGSGRNSPRNQYVAKIINESGLATALVDLLTEQEGIEDEKTRKIRFDINLLSDRLVTITNWIMQQNQITQRSLNIGYYGASTGAAAALIAAANLADKIKAIVSRGGRVDLASSSLKRLSPKLAILFLVGSSDPQTIYWNQKALHELKQVTNKRLVLVQGAGHLFEEEGRLEELAQHAASWFELYL